MRRGTARRRRAIVIALSASAGNIVNEVSAQKKARSGTHIEVRGSGRHRRPSFFHARRALQAPSNPDNWQYRSLGDCDDFAVVDRDLTRDQLFLKRRFNQSTIV